MAENRNDPTKILQFDVPASHIYVDDGDTVPESAIIQLRHDIAENRTIPDRSLSRGFQYARIAIQELQREFGLVQKDRRDMKIAVLTDDQYNAVYKKLGVEMRKGSSGNYSVETRYVVLREGTWPDYMMSSFAFHEFVHKYLERKVNARTRVHDSDGEVRETQTNRRGGLYVDKIVKVDGTTEKRSVDSGAFLNELGNYLEQSRFIEHVLNAPEFAEEARKRKQLLDDLGVTESEGFKEVTVYDSDHHEVPVRLSVNHIHADAAHQDTMSYSTIFFYMQFARDLEVLCDADHEPGTFRSALLRSKLDPKAQNELRDLVDTAMGKGYYTELKNGSYSMDFVMKVLPQVQEELYGFVESVY